MIKTSRSISCFRRRLFSAVSAAAIFALTLPLTTQAARATDFEDAPMAPPTGDTGFWMELGGMFAFWPHDKKTTYFLADAPLGRVTLKPKDGFQVFGGMGFNLPGTGWSFAFRGKGGATGRGRHEPNFGFDGYYDGKVRSRESHVALDFEIGRDVGLGAPGLSETDLKLIFGVRYAQLNAHERLKYEHYLIRSLKNRRTTQLAGPRLGFESSTRLGNSGFSFDLNAAGAVLFGKQKAHSTLRVMGDYAPQSVTRSRKKTVTVANVDGFAGFSMVLPGLNGKVAIGYSVDAYFNALDVGFDKRQKVDRIIHGPAVKFTLQLP